MAQTDAPTLHASCVAMGERAALITGASGSGKSTLALRLIGQGAMLVADDQVHLRRIDQTLHGTPPAATAGLLEVRGLGLLQLNYQVWAQIVLVIDLDLPPDVPRLPQLRKTSITDVCLPLIPGKNRPNLDAVTLASLRHGRHPLFLDPDAQAMRQRDD
ncbi:MAG: HPr kinase/phosphatase C-terminal domain-containing protein, partial [Pseudomonadota bacterium]